MNETGGSKLREQTGPERQRHPPLREFARQALWDTVALSALAFVEEQLEIDGARFAERVIPGGGRD